MIYYICPRCHIALRSATALCQPCGKPGNGTVRNEDGSIGRPLTHEADRGRMGG